MAKRCLYSCHLLKYESTYTYTDYKMSCGPICYMRVTSKMMGAFRFHWVTTSGCVHGQLCVLYYRVIMCQLNLIGINGFLLWSSMVRIWTHWIKELLESQGNLCTNGENQRIHQGQLYRERVHKNVSISCNKAANPHKTWMFFGVCERGFIPTIMHTIRFLWCLYCLINAYIFTVTWQVLVESYDLAWTFGHDTCGIY